MKVPLLPRRVFNCIPNPTRSTAIFAAITALFFVAALSNSATAQSTNYWRSAAGNNLWANDDPSNINNWFRSGYGDARRPDLADGQWSASAAKAYNIIIFDNSAQPTMTVNAIGGAKYHVAEIRFADGTSRTINSSDGGYLAMSNASGVAKIESVTGGAGTYTFNVPILFEENTEINAVNGNLVFGSSSTITNNGFTLTSYTSSARTAAFNGVISGGGGLEHKGDGLVTLGAANTYTGATTIEGTGGGRIQIENASALGTTAAGTTVSSGAALQISGSLGTTSEGLTLNGTGISDGGALRNISGNSTWSGAITLDSASRINSDSGTLTIDPTSGNAISGSFNLTLGGAGNITINDPIATGSGTLTKDGGGILLLGGNNTYEGVTAISAGTLAVSLNNALGATAGGTTVASGATLDFKNVTYSTAEAVTNNGGTIAASTGTSSFAGAITLGGNSGFNVSGTLTASGGIGDGVNSFGITKSGSGTLVLSTANSYDGSTEISAGAVLASSASALGASGSGTTVAANAALQLSNGITINDETLGLSGSGISSGGALRSISGSNNYNGLITLSGGNTYLAAAEGATLKVSAINGGGNELWVAGDGTTILGSGATNSGSGTAFVKVNVGTAVLSASNAWSGDEYIRQGTVILSHNNALGVGGTTYLGSQDGAANSTATLQLGSGIINSNALSVEPAGGGVRTLSYQGGSGTTGTQLGGLTLNTNSLALNVASGGTLLLAGSLAVNTNTSDLVRLAVDGGGTVVVTNSGSGISGNDRYQVRVGNGSLVIGGGTIIARTNVSSPGAGHAIDLGVSLAGAQVPQTASLYASNGITISNSIYVGTTAGDAARVIGVRGAGAAGATFSGPIGLADSILTVDATDANVLVSGAITNFSGTADLTKIGTGTATLAGANSYNGATTISAGTLNLNGSSGAAAGSTASISVANNAKLLISQSDQVNNTATVSLSGGTITRGGNVSERFGNLVVDTSSFLDYGADNAVGTLRFGTYTPTAKLTVLNFLPGNKLQFGSTISSTDLNNSELFSFSSGFTTGSEGGVFTITAIPEPSTYVAAAGLLAMFLWPVRRRVIKDIKSILGLRPTGRERIEAYRNA